MPGLMQQGKDSTVGTIVVALAVCLVCSVIVSFAAVTLRPIQDTNKTQDFKRNILSVVGMLDASRPIDEQFAAFETRVINFETGEYAPEMNTEEFDQRKSSKDPELSINLTAEQDMADIKRREKYGQVFLVRNDDDSIRFMVLPVRGYGLWSTLYGFLALEGDGKTIVGLSFYEHAETPGLGGEV
ncbi:MAG: NADH:ubiquinone reductase (Na(+)-transporting) subunit C, partial [Abyssibacter sp.]|uniref:NADH:ubiquinone reductase (Na(+)-transporting) subunit C n=1 Tax=Abyssibacter sp. TaxID=2320200 RepID=UPI00321A5A35